MDRLELSNGTSCSIAVEWGCNITSWIVEGNELVYCPAELPAQATKITGGGCPLLFPSVGRTWDRTVRPPVQGRYRIAGSDKTYLMPSHGIIYGSRFVKVEEELCGDVSSALYRLEIPPEVIERNYPFDVAFSQRFTLTPNAIELETTIINSGSGPAPAAFGHHPYFRVSNPAREGVEVRLPVTKELTLDPEVTLPDGGTKPADGVLKLQAGVYYDNVFSGVTGRRMSLIDSRAQRRIAVEYDDSFEMLVVYAPDDSDFVCIEPWTRGLGAFGELDKPGWESGELIPVLKPGEAKTLRASFGVEQS
jgi:galactose mutarotase-like enzyme